MSSPAWFPFFPADFLAATATWHPTAVGGYIRLLAAQATSSTATIPNDESALARAAAMTSEEWTEHGPTILAKFTAAADGALSNARLAAVIAEAAEKIAGRAEAGRKAAAMRWQSERNATALPTQCDRNTTQNQNQNQKKKKKKTKSRRSSAARLPVIQYPQRVRAAKDLFAELRTAHFLETTGRRPPALVPDPDVDADIDAAIERHDTNALGPDLEQWNQASTVLDAIRGLFLDPHHCGQNDRNRRYLEPWRPVRQLRDKPDPVPRFAQIARDAALPPPPNGHPATGLDASIGLARPDPSATCDNLDGAICAKGLHIPRAADGTLDFDAGVPCPEQATL